jgi:hypothetical protein
VAKDEAAEYFVHPVNRGMVFGYNVDGHPFVMALFEPGIQSYDEAKAFVDAADGVARRVTYTSNDEDLPKAMEQYVAFVEAYRAEAV